VTDEVDGPARRGAAVTRAFDRATGSPPIPGNRVQLLQDGPEVYAAMLGMIAGAKHWVHFENYIIRNDRTGRVFAQALVEAAGRGVQVRLLYDWLGSVNTSRRFWAGLRAGQVDVRCFNRFNPLKGFGNLSRDHRKLVVADGTESVLGGLCIGDEWAGNPDRKLMPWRDTAVQISGPASAVLDEAFAYVWRTLGPALPEVERVTDVSARGEAAVRVVAGEPGRERAYRVLEYMAAGCGSRLWITDAYLVPPPRLFTVMVEAARDGADIRLLVPGTSDIAFVRNLTRIGYRDLLRAGIRIFEWEGPMLHAKTAVADGAWVRVGSSNLNASSLLGNYELDVVIEDQELARTMEGQFRKDLALSFEVQRQPYWSSKRLEAIVPARLTRHSSGQLPVLRPKASRSLRGRTAIATRTLISGAWRSVLGPLSLGLVVVGLLFIGLPKAMAYAFGAICLWLSLGAAIETARRRND
jgi:cardiolipin synthase A/B